MFNSVGYVAGCYICIVGSVLLCLLLYVSS